MTGPAASHAVVAVILALDAAATISGVVAGTRRHLRRIVVVDDGSTDGTAALAEAAGAEVIRHPLNRGKGAALLSAFGRLLDERAAGAVIDGALTLDADGQHDPDDIPAFLELRARLHPAIVVGSRARHFREMWGPRRLMNRFSSAALRFFCGVDLPDSQSGFRLYDARFLQAALSGAPAYSGGPGAPAAPGGGRAPLGRRYEAEMELLMRAACLGSPIADVPIRLTVADGRATSHYRPLRDTFRIIGAVLRERARGTIGRGGIGGGRDA